MNGTSKYTVTGKCDYTGILVHWYNGTLVYWYTGVMVLMLFSHFSVK